MAKVLNLQARSQGGATIEFAFPLHPDTVSVEVVTALVKAALAGIDSEARKHPKVSPSDVIQALAIALSARANLTRATGDEAARLAKGLLEVALASAGKSKKRSQSGTA